MNYELAKQLKDTGFPQPAAPDDQYWLPSDSIDGSFEKCYDPSLEELIEACDEGFEILSRDTSTETLIWICNNYHDVDAKEEQVFGWYEGSTPTEAVARLWLALNKK